MEERKSAANTMWILQTIPQN